MSTGRRAGGSASLPARRRPAPTPLRHRSLCASRTYTTRGAAGRQTRVCCLMRTFFDKKNLTRKYRIIIRITIIIIITLNIIRATVKKEVKKRRHCLPNGINTSGFSFSSFITLLYRVFLIFSPFISLSLAFIRSRRGRRENLDIVRRHASDVHCS